MGDGRRHDLGMVRWSISFIPLMFHSLCVRRALDTIIESDRQEIIGIHRGSSRRTAGTFQRGAAGQNDPWLSAACRSSPQSPLDRRDDQVLTEPRMRSPGSISCSELGRVELDSRTRHWPPSLGSRSSARTGARGCPRVLEESCASCTKSAQPRRRRPRERSPARWSRQREPALLAEGRSGVSHSIPSIPFLPFHSFLPSFLPSFLLPSLFVICRLPRVIWARSARSRVLAATSSVDITCRNALGVEHGRMPSTLKPTTQPTGQRSRRTQTEAPPWRDRKRAPQL